MNKNNKIKWHHSTGTYRETGRWLYYKKGLAHLEFHLSTKQCAIDFLEILEQARQDVKENIEEIDN